MIEFEARLHGCTSSSRARKCLTHRIIDFVAFVSVKVMCLRTTTCRVLQVRHSSDQYQSAVALPIPRYDDATRVVSANAFHFWSGRYLAITKFTVGCMKLKLVQIRAHETNLPDQRDVSFLQEHPSTHTSIHSYTPV